MTPVDPEHRAPKVFLSHASEDKERFVLGFARRLREDKGLDVWFDRWEIYPGDSLIDKIFEEGLKDADAVIVVLSKFSVGKKWVREELNVANVKRINSGSRLVPVIIDDCEIPEALMNLVWVKIDDLDSYSIELDRIAASIFGRRLKPPLGLTPGYAQEKVPPLPLLSQVDTLVLRVVGEEIFTSGNRSAVYTERLWAKLESFDLPRKEFEESLLVLVETGFLEKGKVAAPFPPYFSPTVYGTERYAATFLERYKDVKYRVASVLVNTELRDNDDIAREVGQSIVLVTHILYALEMSGWIETSGALGGNVWACEISPRLRRALEDNGI